MTVEINLFQCRDGDIVAEDIKNANGVKLVASGTTLNEYTLQKLRQFDIDNIKVIYPPEYARSIQYQREIFEQNYKENIKTIKNILKDLSVGKELDKEKILFASDEIYKSSFVNSHLLIQFLNEIKETDEYTYQHSINVAFYAMLIAQWGKLSEKEVKQCIQAGLLHDVGKSKIPNNVLNKPAKLTKSEFEIIKKHPVYGYHILNENRFDDIDIKRAVLFHHERIDGTGYPFGITADKIGTLAQIVAVADVYDAMTSNRVYKKKVTPFVAFEMFMTEGYSHFDPYIINQFISHMAAYLTGARVSLSNGERGKIVYIPPDNVLFPVICSNGVYISTKDSKIKIMEMI